MFPDMFARKTTDRGSTDRRPERRGNDRNAIWAGLALIAAAALSGCSKSPARVEAPAWDPESFAEAAIAAFDGDGNERIDKSELSKAPGLAAGAALIDQDGDGALTLEELTSRFALYAEQKLGLSGRTLRIVYRGRPLAGADVTLVPETFLEGVIEPATGQTNEEGLVIPNAGVDGLPGMRSGYYRVQVTSAKTALPAKFNANTIVGVEVSNLRQDPASYGPIEVRLVD